MEQTNKFDVLSKRRKQVAELYERKRRMLRLSSSTFNEVVDDKNNQHRRDNSDNSIIENSDDEIVQLPIKSQWSVGKIFSATPNIDHPPLCVITTSTEDIFDAPVKYTKTPHALAFFEDSLTLPVCSASNEDAFAGSEAIMLTNTSHAVTASHADIQPYNVVELPASENCTNKSHANITSHDNSSSSRLLPAYNEDALAGSEAIILTNTSHTVTASHDDIQPYNVVELSAFENCTNKSHTNITSHDNSSSPRLLSAYNEDAFAGSETIILTNTSHAVAASHDDSSSPNNFLITSLPNNVFDAAGTSNVSNSKENDLSDISMSPKKRKRMRASSRKSYIDFVSDNEQEDFSAGSSDLWTYNDSDDSGKGPANKRRKRFQKIGKTKDKDAETNILIKKKNKPCNQRKIRQKLRNEGKSFETKKGKIITEKNVKENPCVEGKCLKKCYEITEEKRYSLFTHFYNLDTQRRRDWLLRCCKVVPVKRKRTSNSESRRNATYEYYINEGEGHRQVCQQFLLSTLDITQKYLRYTIQNACEEMAQPDMRKPNVQPKYTEEAKAYVHSYINKLPIMPSHYSRKRSNKMYLPQEFKNITHVFRNYSNDCLKNDKEAVSDTVFRQIFQEYNIGIHVPKKDKCVLCAKTDNTNVEIDETLQKHLEEKKASYKRFKIHQNLRSSTNDTITTSFDLQKVLNTPYGESMLLFYSRKYAVYNLTFYESTTQDVFCYTWGESEGKRGSNEISTCLLKYLELVDGRGVKNLLLYCDSCSGQNKNKAVLATINNFLKKCVHLEVVQINYLLPGHTYMPVDSVHAVIEREVKRLIVWGPSQWPTFFATARKRPRPYYVNSLDHTDFLDFEDLASVTFTPSTLKNIKFKEIKTATFKKKYTDYIFIKYSMKENATEIQVKLSEKPQRKRKEKGKWKGKGKGKGKAKHRAIDEAIDNSALEVTEEVNCTIKSLYTAKLPISAPKYNDLKRLCENGTIPKIYHVEYLNLPSSANVSDILAETDIEDGEDTENELI